MNAERALLLRLGQPDLLDIAFVLPGTNIRYGIDGLMALFGIESPGLTSSLAIGEAVAEALTEAS